MTQITLSTEQSESFEAVYERHVNMLFRVALAYVKSRATAEDIVADAFLKLLKANVGFKSQEHEKAWLLRTTINLCKNHQKHWWNKRADIDDYQSLASSEEFRDDEVLKAVMELPERYKAAIYLYYYEGYDSKEIAEMLEKPRSTILNHLSEARKLLKGVLENEG